jgi:hypothetical protein
MKRLMSVGLATMVAVGVAWGTGADAAVDCGAPVPAPQHQVGEKWTWQDERGGTLSEEVLADGDLTQMKLQTGAVAFHDKDLIVRFVKLPSGEIVRTQTIEPAILGLRAINPTVGHKTLDFPLQVGKKEWGYSYTAVAARGGRGNLAPFWVTFKVVACEDVSTPAGTFPAFKVEVSESYNDRATTATSPAYGGVYHLWFAPQVKNYVKRHYEPDPYWIGFGFRDFELVKYETK